MATMDAPIRTLSVIIPCYNEEKTIAEVVARVKKADTSGLALDIVVVDDGSRDRSREILRGLPGVRAVFHERNLGKGGAVKTGLAAAKGEALLIQDADLEYDPADYPTLLAPLLEGRADVVMGSRFMAERPHFFRGPKRSPFFSHYIGNILITGLTNLLFRGRATDYYACYKVFRRSALDGIEVQSNGFEFDNELICKLLRRRRRLLEVPVRYAPRSYAEGKKITWKDGLIILWTIVKWRFMPF